VASSAGLQSTGRSIAKQGAQIKHGSHASGTLRHSIPATLHLVLE
jgi:hypothetical protein